MCISVSPVFLETVFFFYFQTITEKKIEYKKLGGRKRFPQFLLSMYVFCMCVCVCVCVFVCLWTLYRRHRLT